MPTGDVLAVVSQSGPTVVFHDADDFRFLGTVEVPAEPHELCFDPEHRLLYCSIAYRAGYYHANEGRARELVVIDPDARRVLEVIDLAPEHGPHGLALDGARGLLYISVEEGSAGPGGAVVLDTRTRKVTGRIDTEAPGPHWFAITPDGRRGYATNKEAPFVSAVDLETGRLLRRVPVPGSEGIAITPDGAQVCVATPYGDFRNPLRAQTAIQLIDTATNEVVRTIPTEHRVFPVHCTSTGLLLAGGLRMSDGESALGAQQPGVLWIFAVDSGELLGSVDVGCFPLTITSSPDGTRGYVAAVVSSTVSVVDLESHETLATLQISRSGEPGAHGLAHIPAR
ncbi:putative surface layer protein [Saccharopolyspora subtropica]|uniref:Surface layer protein n=1 Tax=Saccharopolyspora thermophila TaxID=89367 RepID=A0A917JN77_9PSEU|nr:YncE family protein [Saccharopolyspora subtropica]GGI78441.1 putative surface layer protein [Saccharopolyspora subtropica]